MRIPIPRFQRAAAAAAVGALALAGLGVSPALAAGSTPSPTIPHANTVQHSSGRAEVSPVCSTPKAGQFSCFALKRTDVSGAKGVLRAATGGTAAPLVTPSGFGPADLTSAYAIPANGGAGQTVAIVDAYDDPNAEADLAVYRQQYGLPACTTANGCFKKIDQNGGTNYPSPDSGWSGEISLDLDMVSAVAPNANIILVEAASASFDDLGASVDQAVAQGAKFVSNSYGTGYNSSAGSGEDPSETTAMDPYYNHPGVAVVASSGDSAYGVAYPAASQYVTSVGGTSLTKDTTTARGWTESVWNNSYGGGGSGCSVYEPKPSWQQDSGCGKRTVADVAAVADPVTGVAVYQTYGGGGWSVYGGTSAASPLIAGVYADAGTPVAGSVPASYPYADTSALNDVTSGSNGSCTPAYLCTAETGYDGPTGLGTPNGLDAFRSGPHGEVKGTVTDNSTGKPISGASVAVGDRTATTGADGGYDLIVPPGTYDVTASAYGYAAKTISGATVTDGGTVTDDFALSTVPRSTISGTVTDGSGKGWPMYASISVRGAPGGPVHTDPKTGAYSVQVPQGANYKLDVTPFYPGYTAYTQSVTVGTTDVTQDIADPVDTATCLAPGYHTTPHGVYQTFAGSTTPSGWTVTNAPGTTGGWSFTNPGNRVNETGGSGNFAIADSDHAGPSSTTDTTLTSAPADLSAFTAANPPMLSFDTSYHGYFNSTANAQLSTDGGTTWTTVWTQTTNTVENTKVSQPIPQAAGQSDVLVRFHYTGQWAFYWEVDNVLIGATSCDTNPGGLIVGKVTDHNTGAALPGATVQDAADASVHATSGAVDDAALGGAFYWAYSPNLGARTLNASAGHYTGASAQVNVADGQATEADFDLKAGRITLTPSTVSKSLAWGGKGSATATVTNTGSAPATVQLGTQPGNFTMQGVDAGGQAPVQKIAGPFNAGDSALAAKNATAAEKKAAQAAQAAARNAVGANGADSWSPIANYPTSVTDNVTDNVNGNVYSGFGFTGSADTNAMYEFDPGTQAWSQQASASDTREAPAHGVLGGKIYITGGWGASGNTDAKTEVYDPSANSWSTAASSPAPYAGAGNAAMGGKLYVIGGCNQSCGTTDAYSYDPTANSWTQIAPYPVSVAWEACGPISGKLYCAGGYSDSSGALAHAYTYDPSSNTWSQVADMPAATWGAAYTAANGQLLVQDGVVNGNLTNQGYSFDPSSGTWAPLPNAPVAAYRFGGALGFYTVGGGLGLGSATNSAALLSGWDLGDNTKVGWLSLDKSSLTLAPGASATVTLSFDASDASITQPGNYTASVVPSTDTPYHTGSVGVTMSVSPPTTWGKVAGTVSTANSSGTLVPIAGATISITGGNASYTLHTDAKGHYQLWLDVRNNPLTMVAAKDGYSPQSVKLSIKKGVTNTQDWTLVKG